MARTLPNSKINAEKIDPDQAYNRAVNRGDALTFLTTPVAAQVQDQANPKKVTADKGGEG